MIHDLPHGQIIRARVETVYPTIAAGSVTLVHSDGPYGLSKAEWDKVKDLAAWYRPHIAEWGRICAPSASVYLWNTAEGWAAIHPEMIAAGWRLGRLVTWDKGDSIMGALPLAVEDRRTWPEVTEVCGVYHRDAWDPRAAREEVLACGLRPDAIDRAVGVACMASRMWLGADVQARPPSERDLASVRAALPQLGGPWRVLRPRADFACPSGVSNVWRHPIVTGSAGERVLAADGTTLHPCQKPLLFARRIVEASSRPGDLVFEPFGGTCRIAAACEDIARWEPEKARRYVCVEMDEDGRDYVPAVLASLRGEAPANAGRTGQVSMFGKGAA